MIELPPKCAMTDAERGQKWNQEGKGVINQRSTAHYQLSDLECHETRRNSEKHFSRGWRAFLFTGASN